MKKVLLIISIFISGFGFSQTITGIGNITDPSYGLVGLPGCGIEPGDTFTFSGSGFTIGNDNFSIIADGGGSDIIPFNISNFALGIYSFEVPNVTNLGSNFKLSGQIAVNETPLVSSINITVLSCPIANNNQPTIELGEVVPFFGNDLDLVSSIDLSVAGENLIYPNVPFQYFGNGIMNVTFPSGVTLLNKFLIPTLNYPITIGGIQVSIPFSAGIQVVAPIPAPIITTVTGNILPTGGGTINITGNNIDGRGIIINLGGVVSSLINQNGNIILYSLQSNDRITNPYITVTDVQSGKSDTWYFPALMTFTGNGSLLGENFDDFNTSLDGSNFLKTIPFEYNTTGFGPQLGLLAYNANGIKLFQFGKNISGIPLTLSESSLATVFFSNISEIKTKDITGDGFPEIFALTSNGIEIFGFNELSGFIQINNIPIPPISNFDIGDVNNDGFNDLVTMNQNSVSGEFGDVYLGSKNGISPFVSEVLNFAGEAIECYDVVIADLDNNTTNEISFIYKGIVQNKISIISFDGVAFYSESENDITTYNAYADLKTIDLDNDGLLDFAAVAEQSGSPAKFVQVLQNPIGVFTNSGIDLDLPLETIDDIAYFYGDGDNKIDFVISGEVLNTQINKTFLFQNSTNGSLQLRTFTGAELTTSGESLTSFATADLNGDGSVDIVGTNSITGITILKNNNPCGGSITQSFSSQIPVVTIGGDNLFTLKYSGSKPNAINWTVSVPGIVGFSSLTTSLGSAMVSFTNTFEKTINDQLAAGLNYYNTVSITNIPLSLSGAILNAQISNFCNSISNASITISVLDQTACPTVSAANFSFSGDQFPLSIGSSIAFFDVIEPNPYSISTNYAFYIVKNNVITPLIDDNFDIKLQSSGRGVNNFSRLRISNLIFSTLDGANLFAVASYCGGNFTVFGLNTITVNSCLTDINIFPKNSSKPFCEFNDEEFESTDGAAVPANWQISTSVAGVFTNFNTVTGLYTGTNKSILGITTLLSSLNGKSIRFTYNGNCLSEPYLLEIDTKPRFLSPLTNPEPVCGSRGLIEIVAEVPSNLRNPSYQWYRFNSSTAGVFVPITSFTAPYGSVTTGLLSLTNPDISLDQTQYQLQLSANCGSQNIVATSQPAMIRVLDGPPTGLSVIQNPAVCDGADVSKFFITALGADMQYVWEENNAGTWQVIAEDNVYKPQFDTLFVIDANRANFTNRTYRVSITSACFTGTGASVTSNQDATYSFYDRPVITSTISGNCILGSSILSVTPNTSYNNYTWILANGKNTIISKSLEPNYSLILPNTYNVYVNNNKRCTAVQSFPFAYPALVRATITKESTIKENALVANEAVSYQWYAYGRHITGAINRKFIGNYNGKYTVKVKYANSCEDVSDTSFVNVAGYLDILRSEAIITDTSITFINKRNIEDDFIKIAIAPNPTNDVFKASFMAKRLTPKLISLLDVNGAVRLETEAEYKGLQQYAVEIDVKGLQPGIYFLRLIDEDQTRWAKVVVF